MRQNFFMGHDGHIRVKNISAYWLPEFTLHREIGGTIYAVSGSYEGTEPLDGKLRRIMEQTLYDGERHP